MRHNKRADLGGVSNAAETMRYCILFNSKQFIDWLLISHMEPTGD
jgi:hypothetical protein